MLPYLPYLASMDAIFTKFQINTEQKSHFYLPILPKSIRTSLYGMPRAISNMKLIGAYRKKLLWRAQTVSTPSMAVVKYEFDMRIGVTVT